MCGVQYTVLCCPPRCCIVLCRSSLPRFLLQNGYCLTLCWANTWFPRMLMYYSYGTGSMALSVQTVESGTVGSLVLFPDLIPAPGGLARHAPGLAPAVGWCSLPCLARPGHGQGLLLQLSRWLPGQVLVQGEADAARLPRAAALPAPAKPAICGGI